MAPKNGLHLVRPTHVLFRARDCSADWARGIDPKKEITHV
jgi:hypothetical protein